MKIIQDNVEKLSGSTIQKHLELCGRVCYNSVNAIKDGSDSSFLSGIINRGHTSVLEHASICLAFYTKDFESLHGYDILVDGISLPVKFMWWTTINDKVFISANVRAWKNFVDMLKCPNEYDKNFSNNLYNVLTQVLHILAPSIFDKGELDEFLDINSYTGQVIVVDNNNVNEFDELTQNFYYDHLVTTYKITCSRACQNQLVRHRMAGFSVQSQRYCNYSSDKFEHNINFITDFKDSSILKELVDFFKKSEDLYFNLINYGTKPEDAREVLPNATATIVVMSAPNYEWSRIFDLRCDSHAQAEIHSICSLIACLNKFTY